MFKKWKKLSNIYMIYIMEIKKQNRGKEAAAPTGFSSTSWAKTKPDSFLQQYFSSMSEPAGMLVQTCPILSPLSRTQNSKHAYTSFPVMHHQMAIISLGKTSFHGCSLK